MNKIIPDYTNKENKKLYILKIIIIFIHEISHIRRFLYGSTNNPLLDSPIIKYYTENKKEIGETMELLIGVFQIFIKIVFYQFIIYPILNKYFFRINFSKKS